MGLIPIQVIVVLIGFAHSLDSGVEFEPVDEVESNKPVSNADCLEGKAPAGEGNCEGRHP